MSEGEGKQPKKCGICGKLTGKTMWTPVCDEDIALAKEAFVSAIHAARKKKSEIEKEEPPEETPVPVEPPHDKHQIKKLYVSDLSSGQVQVHYMDMQNPTQDPSLTNEENANLKYLKSEDSWTATGTQQKAQVRLQLNILPKATDIEGTIYCKYIDDYGPGVADPGSYLVQLYRGGGRHSSSDPGLGFAYKFRVKKDRSCMIVKEVIHPEYTSNRGGIIGDKTTRKLSKDPKGHYIGLKLVTYNLPEKNGIVPVMIEGYVDEDGMDNNGNFRPEKQNWKLMAQTIDDGNWAAGSESTVGKYPPLDMKNGTGRRRPDEIGNLPGGPKEGNVLAYRTDGALTALKLYSWRKIKPVKAP